MSGACAALRALPAAAGADGDNLSLVYAAMVAHPASADVQQAACELIADLAMDEENIVTIVSFGGLTHLCTAMGRHRSSVGVQEAACAALFFLTCDVEESAPVVSSGCVVLLTTWKIL